MLRASPCPRMAGPISISTLENMKAVLPSVLRFDCASQRGKAVMLLRLRFATAAPVVETWAGTGDDVILRRPGRARRPFLTGGHSKATHSARRPCSTAPAAQVR